MSNLQIETDSEHKEVGIEYYLNDGPSFSAIIKHRYVDFIVREISLESEIIKLSDITTLPFEKREELFDPNLTTDQCLSGIIGKEETEKFIAFTKAPDTPENIKFTFSWNGSKEERMKFHALIKERLPHFESSTVDGKLTVIRLPPNKKPQERWPKDRPPYLSFILYKESRLLLVIVLDMESVSAVKQIADTVGAKINRFAVAGNKDKRGVTTQKVTCFKLDASKLVEYNIRTCQSLLKKPNPVSVLLTGNYEYVNSPLSMGKLKGNHFILTLRSVSSSKFTNFEELADHCIKAAKNGFINYFGLQRFGTSQDPKSKTHFIGAAIIKGEWEHAVNLIIGSKDTTGKAVEALREKKYQDCLNLLPYYLTPERELIKSLIKCGNSASFRNALSSLPSQTRLIYLHAFCSYVFNKCVSYRLTLGKEPIVGDFVRNSTQSSESTENSQKKNFKRKRDENELPSIHVVTESDIAENRFSIYDIVLPLPGASCKYPTNLVGDYYDKIMQEMGITREMLRHPPQQQFSLNGDYREIVQRAENISCEVKEYNEENEQLEETDRDILFKEGKIQECANLKPRKEEKVPELEEKEEIKAKESSQESKRIALILKFSLPKSAYATMLYRELFKQSTSVTHQKVLATQSQDVEEIEESL